MSSSISFPSQNYIQQIRMAVEENSCFYLDSQEIAISKMKLISEMKCFYSSHSYKTFLLRTLQQLNVYLRKAIDLEDILFENPALKKEICLAIKSVIGRCESNGLADDPNVRMGQLYLTAAQVGISYKSLQQSPDFRTFAEKNHLGFFIETFGHRVQLIKGEICILLAETGDFLPWRKLKEFGIVDNQGKVVGSYSHEGFSSLSQRNWVQIPVFKKEDPSAWDYKYQLELCARIGSEPRGLGDHAWLRVKAPEGNIYSIGFSSDKETTNMLNLLNVKEAFLVSPDYAEFSNEKVYIISSEISRQAFNTLVANLEADKMNDNLQFQLMQSNCFLYAVKIFNKFSAYRIDIHGYSYPKLMYYVFKKKVRDKLPYQLCQFLTKICVIVQDCFLFIARGFYYLPPIPILNSLKDQVIFISSPIISFVFNLLIIMLGGTKNHHSSGPLRNATPYISSFKEMFDFQKTIFFHPFELSKFIRGNK